MKHLFIVNPVAGKGKAKLLIEEIVEIFKHRDEEYSIVLTEYEGHATELARSYSSKEDFRIYSLGGDGTLNEVLNGMVESNSALGVIPAGTGNDFIKSFCREKDLIKLLRATIDGEEEFIDLAAVNQRYYVNIASAGFDAEVVDKTTGFKKLPFISGKMAYVLGIFSALFGYKYPVAKVLVDGMEIKKHITLLAVGNGKYYGGGMLPLPEADIADGLLDVCIIEKVSKFKVFFMFPKLIKGTHGSIKEVSFYRGSKVHIELEKPLPFNVDGEVLKWSSAQFEILPKKLKIIKPTIH